LGNCALCIQVYEGLQNLGDEQHVTKTLHLEHFRISKGGPYKPECTIRTCTEAGDSLSTEFYELCVYTLDGTAESSYEPVRPGQVSRPLPNLKFRASRRAPRDKASAEAFQWIQEHFNACLQSHDRCTRNGTLQMPLRLLEIAGVKSPVKLIERPSSNVPYICLSHRWGQLGMLKTLKSTLARNKKEIEWSSLPMTFQDAIEITFRLNTKYLWIDALCIIQDDLDDWRREAATMCDVYEGARLTIAATRADDTHPGCFFQNSDATNGFQIRGHDDGGDGREISFRRGIDHTLWTYVPTEISKDFSPLLQRAWVLQERVLSSRVLHYTHDELVWECLETTDCECAFLNTTRGIESWKWYHAPSRDIRASEYTSGQWQGVISEYTALSLTKESDILPAISGLARQFAQKRSSRYLAGLWEDSLVEDLCWHAEAPRILPKRATWQAPSWTWASTDSHVVFQQPSGEPTCTVLEAQCDTIGNDAFGQVTGGHLKVRGRIIEAYLEYDPAEIPEYEQRGSQSVKMKVRADNCTRPQLVDWDYWPDRETLKVLAPGAKVHLLFIARERRPMGVQEIALALRPVDGGRSVFERFGVVRIVAHYSRERWFTGGYSRFFPHALPVHPVVTIV
jgi:hypothetical protein